MFEELAGKVVEQTVGIAKKGIILSLAKRVVGPETNKRAQNRQKRAREIAQRLDSEEKNS